MLPKINNLVLLPSPPPSSPSASPTVISELPPPRPAEIPFLIASFIRSDTFRNSIRDLVLPLNSPQAYSLFRRELETPRALNGKEVDSLRYDYCPETNTLTIPCMPLQVHDSVANASGTLLIEMRELNFLSRTEVRSLVVDVGSDVELPTIRSLSLAGSKTIGGTATKQPDAAYYFIDKRVSPWRPDLFPRVVFEVAFSQTYGTVTEDAKHWLVRAQGFVKLVVVLKLVEGRIPPPPPPVPVEVAVEVEVEPKSEVVHSHADSEDGNTRQQHDNDNDPSSAVSFDGNPTADTEAAPDGEHDSDAELHSTPSAPSPASSHSSTAQDYVDYLNDCPDLWVGPISGTLELYRYNPTTGTVFRDGPKYDKYANPQVNPGPRIHITDLLPTSHIEGDATRSFGIPFQMYREYIAAGVATMAAFRRARAGKKERKRSRGDDGSGAYSDAAGRGGGGGGEAWESAVREGGREVRQVFLCSGML